MKYFPTREEQQIDFLYIAIVTLIIGLSIGIKISTSIAEIVSPEIKLCNH